MRLSEDKVTVLKKFGFVMGQEEAVHKKTGAKLTWQTVENRVSAEELEEYVKTLLRNQCFISKRKKP